MCECINRGLYKMVICIYILYFLRGNYDNVFMENFYIVRLFCLIYDKIGRNFI